jgi:hypothetical protein
LEPIRFRAFPQFNSDQLRRLARVRARLSEQGDELFSSDRPADRLARALTRSRTISLKELLESFEFFHRVRRRLRAPVVADLCCGHGLTGILFAAYEREVERVLLIDREQPPSAARLLDAACDEAPWIAPKIERSTIKVEHARDVVPRRASLLAVHACGARTDRCIDVAVALGSPLAAMPCCYRHTARMAPRALHEGLGAELATDVARTYRLEQAGYEVAWSAVPEAITPKNRILVATPRAGR